MPKKDRIDPSRKYLPQRVKSKLDEAVHFPLVSIEAPLGYGKTTSVHEYLKQKKISFLWQNVIHPSREHFWKGFCEAMKKIDASAGKLLENIGYPSREEQIYHAADLIRSIHRIEPVVVVIDGFELAAGSSTNRFFELLARQNTPNLSFFLIGRNLFQRNREELRLKKLLFTIDIFDFMLNGEEIRRYFQECGLTITSGQAAQLAHHTDGWMAAVHLTLQQYNGDPRQLSIPGEIFGIFQNDQTGERSEDEMDFLLRISLFHSFTTEQARFVRRKQDPEKILHQLARSCEFIWKDPNDRTFHLHRLFASFLREQLMKRDERFRNEVFRHAADWYYLNENHRRAAFCYYRSGNFDDALKAVERDRCTRISAEDLDRMTEVLMQCPKPVLRRHPVALMILARHLHMLSRDTEKESVLRELRSLAPAETEIGSDDPKIISYFGELEMLQGYLLSSRLPEAAARQKKAATILRHTVVQAGRSSQWTFGTPSVLFLYASPGDPLDEKLKRFVSSREMYYRLTDNNSRGSEYLMEAELCFYRGSLDRADILAHKSETIAEKYDQNEIRIAALFLQSRIQLIRGNTEAGLSTMKQMHRVAEGDGVPASLRWMTDICDAYIYAVFNQLQFTAHWISDGDFLDQGDHRLYHDAQCYASVVYSRILLDRNEYSKYLGMSDHFIEEAEKNQRLIPLMYFYVYRTVAYRRMHMEKEARESLHRAVELGMKERLILPLTESGRELSDLFTQIPWTTEEQKMIISARDLFRAYDKNMNVLLHENGASPISLLTRREQEVAALVAEGKTNKQIAGELSLAEITVKKCLSNIYARLGISNRTSLIRKMLNQ